jgi:inosine-uridine nucleoside N-ribohydrolase
VAGEDRRDVIIDTDPGTDDALALLLALRSPALNVLGITTVAGNVRLEKASRNALVVVEHSGRQVPVYAGAAAPLIEPLETAEHAHGRDGLGDIGFADPTTTVQTEHAVDFIIRSAMERPLGLDLITIGPLTNIALALSKERLLESRIRSLIMMIGSWSGGNITQVAEYNAGVDPEATELVFRSGVPKTMVALEPIRESARIQAEDVHRLETAGTSWCTMAARLLRPWVETWPHPWLSLCDPAAVAVAIDPSVAESEFLPVVIETRGQHTRGMTVVDLRRGDGHPLGRHKPNVNVVLRFHSKAFRKLVMDTFLAP